MIIAPTSSPWGKIQRCSKAEDGVYFVSTSGHGGFMVHQSVPLSDFLKSIISTHRTSSGSWYCFEEDYEYKLLVFEFRKTGRVDLRPSLEDQSIVDSITRYNPEILIHYGVKPNPEILKLTLAEREYDLRRRQRDPYLIVSKRRIGPHILLSTADGRDYLTEMDIDSKEKSDYTDARDVTFEVTLSFGKYLYDLSKEEIDYLAELYDIPSSEIAMDVNKNSYIKIVVSEDGHFSKKLQLVRVSPNPDEGFPDVKFQEIEIDNSSPVLSKYREELKRAQI